MPGFSLFFPWVIREKRVLCKGAWVEALLGTFLGSTTVLKKISFPFLKFCLITFITRIIKGVN